MIDPSDGNEALASTPSEQLEPSSSGDTPHYEAEYFIEDYSDVVSHDPHLNSDGSFFSLFNRIWPGLATKSTFNLIGETLHRFLLSQATSPPFIRISCRGTQRIATLAYNLMTGKFESYKATKVPDFDFCVDIEANAPVVQWSVPDDEPAYRGHMVREIKGLSLVKEYTKEGCCLSTC